jgi:serine/threonine-protein kinase
VLADIELREQADRMDRLTDSLTVRVLRELGRARAIGFVRGASLGSHSLPALKAFLQGEQFLRRSEWDSSLAYHQRAIALDSGFTLAWSHAGMAAGWTHSAVDSISRTYKLRAGALNHGLAPRESLIVVSESLAAVVYSGPAQIAGKWWTYGKRLVATLEDAVRRYPNDPELWYMLGDARFHAGSLAGLPQRASLEAFDRAIALDSAFTPSYVHAVPMGLEYGGDDAGRRYAKAFLSAGAMGTYAQSTDLVLRLIDPARRPAAIAYLADSADSHLFQTVWLAIGRWTDSAETTVAVMRARVASEQRAGKTTNVSVLSLPFALASRGHVAEAASMTTLPALLTQFAFVGAIPGDSVGRLARALSTTRGEGPLYAPPLLAGRRDTTGLLHAIRWVDSIRQHPLPPQAPPITREVLTYLAAQQRAYLALARGDSAEALRLFDALPDSACFGSCHIDDLVHTQLLTAHGRAADAAKRLEQPVAGFAPGFQPIEVLRALERGRVNERLGNRDRAIEGYSLVVRAWRNPDPQLKPYVEEARVALGRLAGEKR